MARAGLDHSLHPRIRPRDQSLEAINDPRPLLFAVPFYSHENPTRKMEGGGNILEKVLRSKRSLCAIHNEECVSGLTSLRNHFRARTQTAVRENNLPFVVNAYQPRMDSPNQEIQ